MKNISLNLYLKRESFLATFQAFVTHTETHFAVFQVAFPKTSRLHGALERIVEKFRLSGLIFVFD